MSLNEITIEQNDFYIIEFNKYIYKSLCTKSHPTILCKKSPKEANRKHTASLRQKKVANDQDFKRTLKRLRLFVNDVYTDKIVRKVKNIILFYLITIKKSL